ncbi:hypothetical protein CNR22_19775 [Sphingobacteriaceae bacterium]|nr:hypothetical protein CNR22_19775 [Sphingobacteriaceae bacterium]
MEGKKSFWTTLTGGLASAAPILFSVCKGGACVGVCVSPVASLFGISSATVAASPIVNALEPLLIALSAVSFTISYYSLYVLPKLNCTTPNGCACEPSVKEKRKLNINKAVFWIGLILSSGFLSYFEITKYQANVAAAQPTECSAGEECTPGSCSEEKESAVVSECDSTSNCCTSEDNNVMGKPKEMACKLTSPELRKRKETVLAELRKAVIERKELVNGYAFKFNCSDQMLDKLNEFIKSERQCCDFFTFNVLTSGEEVWLELTGEEGVKDFIKTELELVE